MRLTATVLFSLAGLIGASHGLAQLGSGGTPLALPDLGESSSAALSPQMERRIGEDAMRQIRRDPAYLADPEITDYLNELGRILVAASPASGRDFQFFAIKDDTVNAFAMPGGFVGVHTGLLLAAQTESELASVLAHEISHVTQHHIARLLSRSSDLSPLVLAGLFVAALATRSGSNSVSDLGQAALLASQGGAIQAQLGYTRDFEREADRIGFQVLQQAGFDVNGMVSFFSRLQRSSRVYENNAPAYLRSHPLTAERIGDIQNRIQSAAYRQRLDSIEFHLVRAKLRSEQGTPAEALAHFGSQLQGKRYASEIGARFGLVNSLVRTKDFTRAEAEFRRLKGLLPSHPLVELLGIRLKAEAGDLRGAAELGVAALARHPNHRALSYAHVQLLQRLGMHEDALGRLRHMQQAYPKDSALYTLQAQSFAATGKQLLRHKAQAEAYYLEGAIPSAIEQLQLAQRAGDGDFYQLSSVEARLRELRANMAANSPRR